MSNIISLTKVLLKTNLVFDFNSKKEKKNKKSTLFLIGVLLLFVIASVSIPICYTLVNILSIAPVEKIIISLILPLAGVTTIIFSIFSVVSVFYFSKDSDHLLPLPIKSRDLLISKFIVSLINEYYILFLFVLPCLVGVGIGINAGAMYYLYMVLIFLLLPIIPSAIVTMVILLVSKFIGVIKNKDAFMYISMLLIIIFSFGYTYITESIMEVDYENIGVTFAELENNLLPYFEKIFPFYNSASRALINFNNLNGMFSLITFFALNVIVVLIIYWLGDKLYLNSLISTRGSKKKKESYNLVESKIKKENIFLSLMKKEWIIIKRTPVFMLNTVIVIFIFPLVLVFSIIITVISEGGNLNDLIISLPKEIFTQPFIFLIVLLISLFLTGFSACSGTSISREGSNAWFMKTIPISPFKQVTAKVIFASLIDCLGIALIALIATILYQIPIFYIVCILIPTCIADLLINYLCIIIDLKYPKINWNEESVAVKNNFNVFISMLISFAVCVFIGIGAYVLFKLNITINIVLLSLLISIIFTIVLAFVVYKLYKKCDKLFDNID